ncbi:hypothetical protein MTF68_14050 [Pseudoalteromonas sp. 2CM37A]|uniref:hypothetical protein n=1 Tax=Pseudoalteromonas sp. 2CM37A TaxID=2929853 RepID=UPI0020BFA31A|nr:hypothetical protein [Pseudoalteromonas sp. 2CM37A]MCK8118674.1 hypothetical protein [Pseudoalteromonas sp. 2CM37A]
MSIIVQLKYVYRLCCISHNGAPVAFKTDALALKHNKTAMSQLRDEINLNDGFMRK